MISNIPTELAEFDTSKIFAEKIAWVTDNIGAKWRNILVAPDKTMIKADYLIDSTPNPALDGSSTPDWTHILYEQPFNGNSKATKKITSWKNWKQILGLEDTRIEDIPFYVHGSEDSNVRDIICRLGGDRNGDSVAILSLLI